MFSCNEQPCVLPAVGLSRYSGHVAPASDRKDFMLNLNGISSLHSNHGGSYYHQLHHHHQNLYQDVKPCVMWPQCQYLASPAMHFDLAVPLSLAQLWPVFCLYTVSLAWPTTRPDKLPVIRSSHYLSETISRVIKKHYTCCFFILIPEIKIKHISCGKVHK